MMENFEQIYEKTLSLEKELRIIIILVQLV
jgi:hypothetical protein